MQQIKPRRMGLGIGLVVMFLAAAPAVLVSAELRNARIAIFTPGAGLLPVHEAMQEGLARLGYSDGKNVGFVVEDTKGDRLDLAPRAGKLVATKPDMLFAVTNDHVLAAKQATSTLPIVFAWVGDPLISGLVTSYPYSKSNLTGIAASGDSLSGKRLEGLLEIAPKIKRLLVIVSSNERVAKNSFQSTEKAANKLRLTLVRRDVTNEEEIKKALEDTSGSVDAIFHVPSNLVRANINLLITKSKADRVPLSVNEDGLVDRGALVSYGPYFRLVGMQAANLVDKILKGRKPGEIMIETPDRLFLAINQRTARQIGVSIPRGILEQADRLVQ
jgi:putative tryptophan/tyrosine transport system substrate-binding protein